MTGTPSPVLRGGRTFVTGTRLLKSEKALPGRYIVVLDDNVTLNTPAQQIAPELAARHGAEVAHVYANGLAGFVATMTEDSARRLSLDPSVKYVEEDGLETILKKRGVTIAVAAIVPYMERGLS